MNKCIYYKINSLVIKYEPQVKDIRRDIHMHPELGFKEVRTAKIVLNILKSLNIEVYENIARTGVIGILKGHQTGKTVAIRAEMDALPIEEENTLPFKSIYKNTMHACGHDVHTANALGVTMILSELRDEIKGNIKFIFQPSEERSGGGKKMVLNGALDIYGEKSVFTWNKPLLVSEDFGFYSR